MDALSFLFAISWIASPIIANRYRRRWWVWLFAAIFIGPFSTLWLLIIKEPKIKASEEETFTVTFDESTQRTSVIGTPDLEVSISNPAEVLVNGTEIIEPIGYVYVISNPLFPDLVKIGFTDKTPEERIDQLDGTGLPEAYIEHYRVKTKNARELEKRLHVHFNSFRYKKDKEFFKLDPHEVYQVLMKWGVEPLEI